MREIRETCVEHISGEDHITFSSNERKWINHIKRLKERYPNEVSIKRINPDGSLVAHLPVAWFQIKPKKKVHFSEEQIMAATARLEKGRLKRLDVIRVDDVHVGQERKQ